MPEKSELKDNSASATTSDEDSDEEPQVESLVAGRTKRATAGNRLNSLLEKEGDDELELLFAEDDGEEDVEFEGDDGEEASDVQLDPSSDDEDQGPATGGEDLEGEKEIEKQDRAERRKKRKAQEMFKKPGKKVRVDPTTAKAMPSTLAARPKKKSERLSWLPTSDEGPVRSSSRKQTVQNKEVVHLRMQETEARRRQQVKSMEAAAKKKEALKPKAMTQADRMAEAARMEKRNAKSLNRWEETEKRRVEEQKARLEALKNRQLQGPVITLWSGPSKWVNGKLVAVGAKRVVEEIREPVKARSKAKAVDSTARGRPAACTGLDEDTVVVRVPEAGGNRPIPTTQREAAIQPETATQPEAAVQPETAILPEAATRPETAVRPNEPISISAQPHGHPPPVHGDSTTAVHDPIPPAQSLPHDTSVLSEQSNPAPPPPPPPVIEIGIRNLVILENMDGNGGQVPELQNHVLLKKKVKLQKSSAEPCAITNHTARYRDPKTGLAYANSYAYKEIQKLRNGGSRWSDLLGCYVGATSTAARGVPDGFSPKA